ncbi:unnamed protein product [Anisakis simplex]|uniref:Tudor domain-containing protein n=1 Tax=Anisakis simplex TaxID=6269 RepID=A0A0M3JRM7_ANISI|nr:unnamed protein product [Anisakis simplex]
MAVSHEFANLPSTIFDQTDNGDLDVSEEMEEIRELLYELVKTNFPSGVTVEYLAKVYKESYESSGMGPPLPNDWLDHIRVAEEFEVVNRGPIVMVYTRQRNAPPLKADQSPINPLSNRHHFYLLIHNSYSFCIDIYNSIMFSDISRGAGIAEKRDRVRIRLTDKELAQQMKSILVYSPVSTGCTVSVVVVGYDDMNSITIQLTSSRTDFEQLRANMDAHYTDQQSGEAVQEPEVGGVYAVRDTDLHWYRALLQVSTMDTMCCLLMDIGREISVDRKELMHLSPGFALPFTYPIYGISVKLDGINDTTSSMCAIRSAFHTQQPLLLRFETMDSKLSGTHTVQCAVCTSAEDSSGGSSATSLLNRKHSSQTSFGVSCEGGDMVDLVPMELSEMPKNRFAVHVLAVFDVANISIRQRSLDPIPDYIASAVERDSKAQQSAPLFVELVAGRCYAARMNEDSNWERVQLLGPSSVDADCFRVYSLDVGAFGIVRRHNFRFLRVPFGLRKVLLAKCKIGGIKPKDGSDVWSCECQTALCEMIGSANLVEVEPLGEWIEYPEENCPKIPFVAVKLYADGKDIAHQLIAKGLALRI